MAGWSRVAGSDVSSAAVVAETGEVRVVGYGSKKYFIDKLTFTNHVDMRITQRRFSMVISEIYRINYDFLIRLFAYPKITNALIIVLPKDDYSIIMIVQHD